MNSFSERLKAAIDLIVKMAPEAEIFDLLGCWDEIADYSDEVSPTETMVEINRGREAILVALNAMPRETLTAYLLEGQTIPVYTFG